MKQTTLSKIFKSGDPTKIVKQGTQIKFADGTSFWIGDATLYHEPTTSDGGIGWNLNSPLMKKEISEIKCFS